MSSSRLAAARHLAERLRTQPLVRGMTAGWLGRAAPLTIGAVAITLITLATTQAVNLTAHFPGIDAEVYLAAGQRLNDGHPLYALTVGDRPVPNLIASFPLFSPPFLAVIWRPLEAVGDMTVGLWTLGCALAVAACLAVAWRDHRFVTAIAALVMWLPIVLLAGAGNVSALIMAGTVLAAKRPRWAPILIGVMAALKIWPILLALAVVRSRRAAMELATTLAICGAISLIGAGWDNHVAYLGVFRVLPDYPDSLAGMTHLQWLPWVILIVGLLLAILGSFRAAVVASILGNPAMHLGIWATLISAIPDPRADNRRPLDISADTPPQVDADFATPVLPGRARSLRGSPPRQGGVPSD